MPKAKPVPSKFIQLVAKFSGRYCVEARLYRVNVKDSPLVNKYIQFIGFK